jgi:quinoprotein glucose dehydrogenase
MTQTAGVRGGPTRAFAITLAAVPLCLLAHVVFGSVRAQEAAKPDGTRTVWNGVFTEEQAQRGRGLYAEHCARCHGSDLEGGENRALAGERFWISWQETTLDRLLGHITTNMPFSDDGALKGTLGAAVYADITSHILSVNQFPHGTTELTAASGAGVRILRKEGSRELPPGAFAHVVGCLTRGADRAWRLQRGSAPARVLDARDVDPGAPLGEREYVLRFVLTPLDKFAGHRMSVQAALMGEGGADGLNVTSIRSVSEACE